MYNRLLIFFENSGLFVDFQYGFRRGMSTSDAIERFVEACYKSLDKSNYMVSVFLDLSKAFDTLDHGVLIRKLDHVGVRGEILRWLESYLSDRKQRVVVNSEVSGILNVDAGVPQGSILGPLLAFVYFVCE